MFGEAAPYLECFGEGSTVATRLGCRTCRVGRAGLRAAHGKGKEKFVFVCFFVY